MRGRTSSSSHIYEYRRTMRLGQERIDFVSLLVERNRVRTRFRWHDFLALHRVYVDHIYYTGITDSYIKTPELCVQENDVRSTAEGNIAEHTP